MAGLCAQKVICSQSLGTSSKVFLRNCQPCANALLTNKRHKSELAPTNKRGDLTAYKRGTGGRSSFNGIVATVFGASGFLGRYVVNQLGKIGTQVVIPYRGPEYDVDHLKLCGDLGQILYTPFNLKDEDSIRAAVKHSNVVINLIGRDWETKNFTYDDVHVAGAERIARISAESGVQRLIHMSTMNTDDIQYAALGQKSRFIESKSRGEQVVREQFPEAVIMRPADMWGDEDRFVSYWAKHWRKHLEMMPVWKQGKHTIKRPVDVMNVAQGVVKAILDKDAVGSTIECVGPQSFYLYDMLQFFYDEMRVGHINLIPLLPTFLAKVKICETVFPATPPLIMDKLIKESNNDVLTGCPTLEDLGVKLSPFDEGTRYQLKEFRTSKDYSESLHEIPDAKPPPTVAEVDAAKRVFF
ncbi:NADH dehydrogenase [ubiquinone] 1 alpha subcomplex subunit 9, mitochondrial-like [Watersipora subatra]|uniref:NADH dehydrogenase [ubiquinone] 1 alpha subcomplex subunit 9, mitochondrial-like n=1 Tax=Watersipora subatra TaxID=2589382 RepID=UPI00355BEFAA